MNVKELQDIILQAFSRGWFQFEPARNLLTERKNVNEIIIYDRDSTKHYKLVLYEMDTTRLDYEDKVW